MTSHLQESLENLRLRATCAICTELYSKPKQLPNCSHVFCSLCVKRYMQAKLPNNFPPCPMCRAPITRAINDIDLMEPARAEEDIIEFVRPYENCDLCKKRERPILKCLECNGLICENCQLVHGKLQTNHTVVSIFESGIVAQRQEIQNECKVHPNQTLDLFCVMCNTVFCLFCDKYSHSSCTGAYENFANYKHKLYNSSQLLQDFINSSEERKNLIRSLETNEHRMRTGRAANLERSFAMLCTSTSSPTMSPQEQAMARVQFLPTPGNIGNANITTPATLMVVQVNEFATFARNYVRELTEEVDKDVEFYEQYVGRMDNIIASETESPELNERKGYLESEIQELIERGKRISGKNKLTENETDNMITESALKTEITALQFFRARKPFSLDIRCIELALDKTDPIRPTLRQIAICSMQELTKTGPHSLFVDRVEVSVSSSASGNGSSNENGVRESQQHTNETDDTVTADDFTSTENDFIFNTIQCLSVEKSDEYSSRCSNCNNSYANRFSEIAERLHVLIKGGLSVDIETMDDIGFTGNHNTRPAENKCLDKCKFSKRRGKVTIVLSSGPSALEYQTNLVNVFFAAPFSYRDETIMRIDDIEKNKPIPIICLIGSRSLESGVESLFLSKDAGSDFQLTHGIAIRAKIARFKQTDFSGVVGTSVSNIAVYKDKAGLYCLLKGQSYSGRSLVAYSTNIGELENSIPYNIPIDGPDIPIPVSSFIVELLCEMKGGVFYVSRNEDTGALNIGRLAMHLGLTNIYVFTLTDADSFVKTDKLRPLTMAESRREELVVACAVDGDASKLVMVVPMKETTELLEIQYTDSEYKGGEIVDLEMDCDGNIMCLLKDIGGKIWRMVTKYIMP